MRSLLRDILAAVLMGMVIPGILLNFAVMLLQRDGQIESFHVTVPEETLPQMRGSPMNLRLSDGSIRQQDMENYLVGVVLAEMPASFEPEALKAQAVAARTYTQKAYTTGGKHADGSVCTNASCCQAYLSEEDYLSRGGSREDLQKVRSAVRDTSGLCLYYGGELIEATYFSCSGGSTEDAAAVWGTDFPYLQAVPSPGEETAQYHTDTVILTPVQFCDALGIAPEGRVETWFGAVTYTEGGGVETMEISSEAYTGTQLRALLGLRSTAFSMIPGESAITIITRGYGHRVGMSQYGADAMAVNGSTFEQILAHYYPGTELMHIAA